MEDNQCTEFEYSDGTHSECLSATDIAERGLRDCTTHVQVGGQTYCAGQEPRQAQVLGVPQGANTYDAGKGLMDQPVLSPGLLAAGAGLTLMALGVMSRGKKKEGSHGNR
jgi:hypothetical protein